MRERPIEQTEDRELPPFEADEVGCAVGGAPEVWAEDRRVDSKPGEAHECNAGFAPSDILRVWIWDRVPSRLILG